MKPRVSTTRILTRSGGPAPSSHQLGRVVAVDLSLGQMARFGLRRGARRIGRWFQAGCVQPAQHSTGSPCGRYGVKTIEYPAYPPGGPGTDPVNPTAVLTCRATSVVTWKHTPTVRHAGPGEAVGAPEGGQGPGLVSSSAASVGRAASMAVVSIGVGFEIPPTTGPDPWIQTRAGCFRVRSRFFETIKVAGTGFLSRRLGNDTATGGVRSALFRPAGIESLKRT